MDTGNIQTTYEPQRLMPWPIAALVTLIGLGCAYGAAHAFTQHNPREIEAVLSNWPILLFIEAAAVACWKAKA